MTKHSGEPQRSTRAEEFGQQARKALEGFCQGYEVTRSVFLKSHSDGQVEGERPGKGADAVEKAVAIT